MVIRLREAVEYRQLYDIRQNIKEGRDPRQDVTRFKDVGNHIWPNIKNVSLVPGYVYNLSVKSKTVSKHQVKTICEVCYVDPNFLFGYQSEIDSEYKDLKKHYSTFNK
jgi:hypothetical protein